MGEMSIPLLFVLETQYQTPGRCGNASLRICSAPSLASHEKT